MNILMEKLNKIDERIVNEKHTIELLNEYHSLKKEILEKEISTNDKIFKKLNKKIKLIDDYINYSNSLKQKNNIDFLTFINTVFLPIGIIVGYFGMNFSGMGNPTLKTGILSMKNPQSYIFKLSVGSGLILLALLYYSRNT